MEKESTFDKTMRKLDKDPKELFADLMGKKFSEDVMQKIAESPALMDRLVKGMGSEADESSDASERQNKALSGDEQTKQMDAAPSRKERIGGPSDILELPEYAFAETAKDNEPDTKEAEETKLVNRAIALIDRMCEECMGTENAAERRGKIISYYDKFLCAYYFIDEFMKIDESVADKRFDALCEFAKVYEEKISKEITGIQGGEIQGDLGKIRLLHSTVKALGFMTKELLQKEPLLEELTARRFASALLYGIKKLSPELNSQ